MKALSMASAGLPLKILCLGAHADDIEIGAGGTILGLIAAWKVWRSDEDDDDGGAVDVRIRHGEDGDAVQLLHIVLRPDFGAQQTQAHLYQAVVQVDEHHVVAAGCDGVIEGDGANFLGMRVTQPFQTARP